MYADVTFDFTGRAVIVTGVASPSGIGRSILRGFAQSGASVAGCDIDDKQLADVRENCHMPLSRTWMCATNNRYPDSYRK